MKLPISKANRRSSAGSLPENARVSKRPLLRPPIPSPYTSSASPKIIYVSAKTPFISAVKRVRKLLDLIDKRTVGKVDLGDGRDERETLRALGEVGQAPGKAPEEVILKATNRAIEKALGLGLFFQGQEDLRVRLRTGSVGAVDDIVVEETSKGEEGKNGRSKKKEKRKRGQREEGSAAGERVGEHKEELDKEMADPEAGDEDLPETRIRKVSVLEIGISLK
ncbi:MAG: hypothetical protein Q9178_001282 [Gyalolechia marmorata]